LKTKLRGDYLQLRNIKQLEDAENYKMSSFVVYTPRLILVVLTKLSQSKSDGRYL
jgi:hypothetical protein